MSTGGNGVPNIHSINTTKTLLKSEALYQYIMDTTALPQEPPCLRDLRLLTDKQELCDMASPPDEAQLLAMLIKTAGAKNTIEVGVFTGCSLLATALALPDDGKVVAIDVNREYYEVGRPFFEKPGLALLDELLAEQGSGKAQYDFAFVDADKPNYVRYHEQLLQLVRVGCIIVYDNTLWGGTVAMPPDTPMSVLDTQRSAQLRDLNAKLAADPRVHVCQLPIADGVTICCRVV